MLFIPLESNKCGGVGSSSFFNAMIVPAVQSSFKGMKAMKFRSGTLTVKEILIYGHNPSLDST